MSTNRQDIIDRVRKLRQMTQANGCTENEALVAAKMLAKLISDNEFTSAELNAERFTCRQDYFTYMKDSLEWTAVNRAIEKLFSVRMWTDADDADMADLGFILELNRQHAFGYPQDVEAAIAMAELCYTAIAHEAELWGKTQRKRKGLDFRTFRAAMAKRLSQRIAAMIPTQITGTALIVLKNQLVSEEFAKIGVKRTFGKAHLGDLNAYKAGWEAGARVGLNSSRVSATKQIG